MLQATFTEVRVDSPNTTSFADFRDNLSEHFRQIKVARRPTVVLRGGRAAAVMLSPTEFNDYAAAKETLDILQAIERGRREHAEGKTIPWGKAKREILAKMKRRESRKAG